MVDLRVNNEALLCMLERERQHSQQLAQALHQVQADALEVTLLHSMHACFCKARLSQNGSVGLVRLANKLVLRQDCCLACKLCPRHPVVADNSQWQSFSADFSAATSIAMQLSSENPL